MKLERCGIHLRPYEVENAQQFYDWFYSGKYDDYFRHCEQAFRLADFQRFTESPSFKIFCIFKNETRELIGTCGIYDINANDRSCKLMALIDEKNQCQANMPAALILLGEIAIIKHGFHKLSVDVMTTNERLNRIIIENGWIKESTLIDSCWLDGRWVNENVYYMLEDTFRKLHYKK